MQLVFLYGPAAAGKLTVGRALSSLTGLPLFHNHLIVDAVAAVFPFGSEPFVRLRHRFWLETFAAAAADGRSLIFTFAPEASVPASFPQEAATAVAPHGGRVRFAALDCPVEEQERRIANSSRAEFGKLRDLELLRRLRAQGADAYPELPAEVQVDTLALLPDASARRIADALDLPRA